MLTDYRPLTDIAIAELFDGRLEKFGVREHMVSGELLKRTITLGTKRQDRCLTDGADSLWVRSSDDGMLVRDFRRNGIAAGRIIPAIAEAFGADIVSQYEPEFWGFATYEEWDARHDATDEAYYRGVSAIESFDRGEDATVH